LRIIHVLPLFHSYATTEEGRAQEARQWDHGVVDEATAIVQEAHPDLEVTSALPSGTPAAVLLAEAEHAHPVVLGAKGMGGFGSLLLGSVALQVVGHAAGPVVIVNHATTGHGRIVVGADGSAHSRAALACRCAVPSCRPCTPGAIQGPTPMSVWPRTPWPRSSGRRWRSGWIRCARSTPTSRWWNSCPTSRR
jgi:nucleotide-binding universal stress UspA family protein